MSKKIEKIEITYCPNCGLTRCKCRPSEKAMAEAAIHESHKGNLAFKGPEQFPDIPGAPKSITTTRPAKLSNAVVKPGTPDHWFILATIHDSEAQGQFTVAKCQRKDVADAIAAAINSHWFLINLK